jgi:hypothetical protein
MAHQTKIRTVGQLLPQGEKERVDHVLNISVFLEVSRGTGFYFTYFRVTIQP